MMEEKSMPHTPATAIDEQLAGQSKSTPSGWRKFNGVCCVHNGERRADTKGRAGYLMTDEGGVIYNCLNCGFKASWRPGQAMKSRMASLLSWMGVDEMAIKRMKFYLYANRDILHQQAASAPRPPTFYETSLPPEARPIMDWLNDGCRDDNFIAVVEYLYGRGEELFFAHDYHWSPNEHYGLNRKLIIPFYFNGILVGWTGRTIDPTGPRYYSEVQPGYLFGNHVLNSQRVIFVTEGVFDALAVRGVATLGAKISDQQVEWLRRSGKTIIVLPDYDMKSQHLFEIAIKNKWQVSFPWVYGLWDRSIKDAAAALKEYGQLYTIKTALMSSSDDPLKIRTNIKICRV